MSALTTDGGPVSTTAPERPARPMLPIVHVICETFGCPHLGMARQVRLQPAAPGVLAAPVLLCGGCGAHMLTVRSWPPDLEENPMAKITRHGGASDARAEPPAPPSSAEPEPEPAAVPAVADLPPIVAAALDEAAALEQATAPEGGDDPSPGTSSSTSSPKDDSEPPKKPAPRPRRARETANRSSKAQTGASSARSTATGGLKVGDKDATRSS